MIIDIPKAPGQVQHERARKEEKRTNEESEPDGGVARDGRDFGDDPGE